MTVLLFVFVGVVALGFIAAVRNENRKFANKKTLIAGDYVVKVHNSVYCRVIKQVGTLVHYQVVKTGAKGKTKRNQLVYMRRQ